MPSAGMGSARETHAANQAESPSGKLSGWAGIEDYLLKHDSGMVKDFADDIDTLLVFAGLFSAVLTAFVVETYSLLQPDGVTTTNQLLAYGFASQFATQQPLPFSFNETLASLVSPSDFTPPTSARWMNALFFLSLVTSLAAAFFGIFAKQWLRAYMRWYAPTGFPQDNIIIRQIRFEAWEAWKVAGIIACIPVALELAMVLFLVGFIIFVRRLDPVVAIVVTVAVVIFLSLAAMFTVLPILVKRCPYRSPTAWVLAVAWNYIAYPPRFVLILLTNMISYPGLLLHEFDETSTLSTTLSILQAAGLGIVPQLFIRLLLRYLKFARDTGYTSTRRHKHPGESRLWREQDLSSVHDDSKGLYSFVRMWRRSHVPGMKKHPIDAAASTLQAVRDKLLPIGTHQNMNSELRTDEGRDLVFYVDETAFLLRALHWTKTAFADKQIATYINESLASRGLRYASGKEIHPAEETSFRYVANRCLLYSELYTNMRKPHLILLSPETEVWTGSALSIADHILRLTRQDPSLSLTCTSDTAASICNSVVLTLINDQLEDVCRTLSNMNNPTETAQLLGSSIILILNLFSINLGLLDLLDSYLGRYPAIHELEERLTWHSIVKEVRKTNLAEMPFMKAFEEIALCSRTVRGILVPELITMYGHAADLFCSLQQRMRDHGGGTREPFDGALRVRQFRDEVCRPTSGNRRPPPTSEGQSSVLSGPGVPSTGGQPSNHTPYRGEAVSQNNPPPAAQGDAAPYISEEPREPGEQPTSVP